MLKINWLESLDSNKKNHLFLLDNLLFHVAFSFNEHIYCENITLIRFLQMI